MPPVDSLSRFGELSAEFSALGDQRAETLAVQCPRVLDVVARCRMRLWRISVFPFFLSWMKDCGSAASKMRLPPNIQTPTKAIFLRDRPFLSESPQSWSRWRKRVIRGER